MFFKVKPITMRLPDKGIQTFPEWLRNRSLSVGLEPGLSQTEKSSIAANCRQCSTNDKIKIIESITVLIL